MNDEELVDYARRNQIGYLPDEKAIKQGCLEAQDKWTDVERAKRARGIVSHGAVLDVPVHYTVPTVDSSAVQKVKWRPK